MTSTTTQLLPDPPGQALDTSRHGRLRVLLVTVPFTFPLWLRLRREDPEAAEALALFGVINIAQSIVTVVVVALAGFVLVYRDQIVVALADWLVSSGIVGP